MPVMISHALLAEIGDCLAADKSLTSWFLGRVRRRVLVTKLEAVLDGTISIEAAPELIAAARLDWSQNSRVRFDDRTAQQIDREGVWIGAWVRAAAGLDAYASIDLIQLEEQIAALPVLARDVFRLHAHEELDYREIAARLGISVEAARDELTSALLLLGAALSGDTATDRDDSNIVA